MKARRTPWWYYLVAALLGLIGGAGLVRLTESSQLNVLGAPWFVSAMLVLIALVVLYMAWQVHLYVKGKRREMDAARAVNTLVLAKALGLAGAALLGWYGGQVLMSLSHAEAPFYAEIIKECLFGVGAALVDMVAGIVSERLCQLPPNQGPEHPRVKAARRRKSMAKAANKE
ncbi:DUF3180 domain-containing protein [Bifidobacterium crudilactis]|jgi:hypothetical protein|uniref:DUF3180 domain-containing protein n=1 Tax=Bifidobacterium crudilactis TaxID=327277 RepID=A0A971ICE8_9BIFI|nr:DUF3180 domain-containing protein [Bifidobacterium crudilactis]MCI1664112.1 DUF3180 domain-containing protein [Bifidobacterium crudilactis]MCI1868218.1 DUF3180 domain-containing protein [Bifidobacterium crudilactis]MCI2148247.1 DUF3180 domain-containing protein [Bifidobacterium crudilactis]MCI2158600.1 DUF3180 domain-containing protein [Bifidobacterium crudilactis]MDN5972779.1 DUF3180 domain-containing protein [Bifidobacterium crudilactis]